MNVSVSVGGLTLRNPIMNASGTLGLEENQEYIDYSSLGAIVAKSVTLNPRRGNPAPRVCETEAGMLNCVGIPNEGYRKTLDHDLPVMRGLDVPFIVSVAGNKESEFADCIRLLEAEPAAAGIAAYEINVSCPNLEHGGRVFGADPEMTRHIVASVRSLTDRPLFVKLTPNVTDITAIAAAASEAGGNAVTVCNTFLAMAIDPIARKPILSNTFGGLSGPAIRPIVLRMVWQIHAALPYLPIIASGGITCGRDVAEYLMAGASAVQVGYQNFCEPDAMPAILSQLEALMTRIGINSVEEMIGCAHPVPAK